MYTVKAYMVDTSKSNTVYGPNESAVLYSDVYPSESAKAVKPKLTMKVNTAGTLEMTLPPGNAGYNRVYEMRSPVVVYRDNDPVWTGRVITKSYDFNNNETLTCEGVLAYLNDTIQPSAEYLEHSVTDFMKAVISNHNSQIEASVINLTALKSSASAEEKEQIDRLISFEKSKKFIVIPSLVDEIAGEDTHDFGTDGKDTLTTLTENLIDKFSGYLQVMDYDSDDGWTLSYRQNKKDNDGVGNATRDSVQQVRFGLNLLDYAKNWDLTDLVTVVYPRGAGLDEFETSKLIEYYNFYYTEAGRDRYKLDHQEIKTDADYKCLTPNEDSIDYPNNGPFVYGQQIPMNRTGVKHTNEKGVEYYFGNSWGGFWRNYWDEHKSGEDNGFGAYLDLSFKAPQWTLENCDMKPDVNNLNANRYVVSDEALKRFGWICAVVDFPDINKIEDVVKLDTEARNYLEEVQFGKLVIEVTSIDLKYLGVVDGGDSIRLLDKVRCVSRPHGLDAMMLVTELTITLDEPDNSTYTMTTEDSKTGDTLSSFTSATVYTAEENKKEANRSLQTGLHTAFRQASDYINSATTGHVTIVKKDDGTEALCIIKNTDEDHPDPLWNFNPETGYWGSDEIFKNPNYNGNPDDFWKKGDQLTENQKIGLWKWNINGLFWSENGGRSAENFAMTNKGEIVANSITAGELSTILIHSVEYDKEQGYNSWWNLGTAPIEVNHGGKNPVTYGPGEFHMTKGQITLGELENATYPFSVDNTGYLYSRSGQIGGFTIDSDHLFNDVLDLGNSGLTMTYVTVDKSTGKDQLVLVPAGLFGTNIWAASDGTATDKHGLVIDIDYGSAFLAFGQKSSKTEGSQFHYKLWYAAEPLADSNTGTTQFRGDMWHFGADINANNYLLKNARIDINTCQCGREDPDGFSTAQGIGNSPQFNVITGIDFGTKHYDYTTFVCKNGFFYPL